MWQAICGCGLKSAPFFCKGTINKDIYIQECLKKRFLPFIRKHITATIFWPDLATSHYTKDSLVFMEKNGITFVPKNINPPNTPEPRPIERYWALTKAKLRKDGRCARNVDEFKKFYLSIQKKVGTNTVQNLMKGIKRKLREFQRKPLIS